MAKSPGRILLMPSLMAIPHISHLMGLASPQMSTPTALRGPCSWGDEAGIPQPMVPPALLPPAGSLPNLWGPHSQFPAVVSTSKYNVSVCVFVCVCVCVRGCVRVCVVYVCITLEQYVVYSMLGRHLFALSYRLNCVS